jgi:WD40 repeat protein
MRNMRLVVGPTTPAATLWSKRLRQQQQGNDDDKPQEEHHEEVEDDDDDEEAEESPRHATFTTDDEDDDGQEQEQTSSSAGGDSDEEEDDIEDSSSEEGDDDDMRNIRRFLGINRREVLDAAYRNSSTATDAAAATAQSMLSPSLRHGGCINTACWLADTDDHDARAAAPPPTKIMTSGDDRLLKIWNVKEAMDLAWENGWDSFAPLTANSIRAHALPKRRATTLPGTVELLHTFRTGHHGNVFHITPLRRQGSQQLQALTSAADGALRLVDEQRSTLILQSEGMAYSHLVLTDHTGLVCYDNGLNQYDLRCSLHSQPDAIITGMPIKACAQYRPTLLFVGGGRDVKLVDIRVSGGTSFFRQYEPSYFDPVAAGHHDADDDSTSPPPRWNSRRAALASVSVSGLDISKDHRSLLVSYESDQIYEFPICPNARSRAGPTMDEIDRPTQTVRETKCFGGHLNRFTFLKNAKYAGPNDEYVVTGSDSGRAWIFRRDTGTVVSLLAADTNTCNGVIPHPTLPFYITYGIDSTAKLWRAAPSYKDDSRAGRYRAYRETPYEMSPVTKTWSHVEKHLSEVTEPPVMYPDFICTDAERMACQQFHLAQSFVPQELCGQHNNNKNGGLSPSSPKIGNALLQLPSELRQNRWECYRLCHAEKPTPVAQPVTQFSLTVLRSRLQFQADRLGAKIDAECPWILRSTSYLDPTTATASALAVHPADLIPDYPSDWILLDKRLTDRNLMDLEDRSIPWLSVEQQTPNGDELFREKVITETAIVLKEAGNKAMADQMPPLAARRLDKAIQYCAVLCMSYLDNPISAANNNNNSKYNNNGKPRPWSRVIQTLVTSRLNLSLALLMEHQAEQALKQGQAALEVLLSHEKTDETLKLRYKAYFRVGSAALASGDYETAVLNLDLVGGDCAEDPVLKRRRTEARHKRGLLLKRRRKKYQKFFDHDEKEKNGEQT